MKIKLKKSFAGPNLSWNAGDVIEVDDAQGERLVSLKYAEEVKEVKKPKSNGTKKVQNNKRTSNRTGNTSRSKGTSKK